MSKSLVLGFLALGAGVGTMFGATGVPRSAEGTGTIVYTDHHEGEEAIGTFTFDLQMAITGPVGEMQFGSEHRHDGVMIYPDFVVRLQDFEDVELDTSSARIEGGGTLNDEPVWVQMIAVDRRGQEADTFHIACFDGDGVQVFHAHGDLIRGDVIVGSID